MVEIGCLCGETIELNLRTKAYGSACCNRCRRTWIVETYPAREPASTDEKESMYLPVEFPLDALAAVLIAFTCCTIAPGQNVFRVSAL